MVWECICSIYSCQYWGINELEESPNAILWSRTSIDWNETSINNLYIAFVEKFVPLPITPLAYPNGLVRKKINLIDQRQIPSAKRAVPQLGVPSVHSLLVLIQTYAKMSETLRILSRRGLAILEGVYGEKVTRSVRSLIVRSFISENAIHSCGSWA